MKKEIVRRLFFIIIYVFCLLLFSSCQIGSSPIEDIYISGSYFNGSKWVAYYWNNGEKTDLTDGSTDAYAHGLYEVENTFYIAGEYDSHACYWKNGERFDLIDGKEAKAITFSSGTVYITGINQDSGACYWENGIRHDLPSSSDWSTAESIKVFNGDIYIAGTFGFYFGAPISGACYWKNQVQNELPASSDEVIAYSLDVSEDGVFVVGVYFGPEDYTACYWENGGITTLDGIEAKSIYISSSDIYIAGRDSETTCYWKNGEKNIISLPLYGHARAIYISEDNVIVAGDYKNGTKRTTYYWENGNIQELFTLSGAEAESIHVDADSP